MHYPLMPQFGVCVCWCVDGWDGLQGYFDSPYPRGVRVFITLTEIAFF